MLAHFGELHPATLKALDVAAPVVGFEIFLDAVPAQKAKSRTKRLLDAADLLPVRRDFAFVLDASVSAGDVVRAARSADKTLIESVSVFDVFEGGALAGEGKKSLAIEVNFSATHDRDADGQGHRGGRAEDRRRGKGRDRRRDLRPNDDPRGASDHRLEVDLALVQEAGFS